MVDMLAKKPIQVHLRTQQLEALRYQAHRRNVTVAELVRQGVDRILAEARADEEPITDMDIVGMVKGGPADVAERHDEYLASMIQYENEHHFQTAGFTLIPAH